MTPERVLVCGSRHWRDRPTIEVVLRRELSPDAVVIHGDNGYNARGEALWGQPDELAVKGADKLSGAVARALGHAVVVFTPDWDRGGRAGPERNAAMLAEGKPDRVIAFHPDLDHSAGTGDMVRKARRVGLPVSVVTGREDD